MALAHAFRPPGAFLPRWHFWLLDLLLAVTREVEEDLPIPDFLALSTRLREPLVLVVGIDFSADSSTTLAFFAILPSVVPMDSPY